MSWDWDKFWETDFSKAGFGGELLYTMKTISLLTIGMKF